MEVTFDFRKEHSRLFGPVLRPVAEITLIHQDKEITQFAYVDSGADITLIPKSVGDLLGLKLETTDEISEIKGVGERGVPIVLKTIKIRISEKTFPARIAWSLIEEVPILLGRLDTFNFFEITFKKESKTQFKD